MLSFGLPQSAIQTNHLQTQQNVALRTISGCVNMSINDLHNEGEMLPVKAHTQKLAEQFLAGSYQSDRADNKPTTSTSFCPRRPTPNDTNRDRVKQHTNNKERLNRKKYKKWLKSIHRHTVHTHNWILPNSYLSRFCHNVETRCPKSELPPHDVNHILNCS